MKKVGMACVAVGLAISVLICALSALLYSAPLVEGGLFDNDYVKPIGEVQQVNYTGIGQDITVNGFAYRSFVSANSVSNGATLYSSDLYGWQAYEVLGHKISYDLCGGTEIMLNIYLDGAQVYSGVYFHGDNALDIVFSGESELDYMYDRNGVFAGMVINSGVMQTVRGQEDRLLSVMLNGEEDRTYLYKEDGLLKEETVGKTTYVYEYSTLGELVPQENATFLLHGSAGEKIEVTYGEDRYTYVFDYRYREDFYVTEILKNGDNIASFQYINDKVVAKATPTEEYVYILDNAGNYIGVASGGAFYLFVYDASGNIYALLDKTGEPVAFVDTGAYGNYTVLSSAECGFAYDNCIIYTSAVVDTETGVLCCPNGIMLPECQKKISLGGEVIPITAKDSLITHTTELKLPELPAMMLFDEAIIDNIVSMFAESGLKARPYVDVLDQEGRTRMTADIYTLDFLDASESLQNAFNGNQAYKICYVGNWIWSDNQLSECREMMASTADCRVDCYGDFAVNPGSLKFNGQLVYLGYLVTYICEGDGIVRYFLSKNHEGNYREWNNIYNYDSNVYENYVDATFDFSLWDYTTIIPGMNREHYEIVEDAFSEVMKMHTQVVQEQLGYLDEIYSSAQSFNEIGDTLRLFDDISPDQMVVVTEKGDLQVKYLPFWDSPSTHKNLIKIGATVVAFAVVAVVAVCVPGCQFLLPIIAIAGKAAIHSVLGSLLANSLVMVVEAAWTGWDEYDWKTAGRNSLNEAVDDGIEGAISGGLSGAWKMGMNSYVSHSKAKKLAKLDRDHPFYLRNDSMQAAMEYDTYKLTVEKWKLFGFDGHPLSEQKTSLMGKVFKEMGENLAKKFGKYIWEEIGGQNE